MHECAYTYVCTVKQNKVMSLINNNCNEEKSVNTHPLCVKINWNEKEKEEKSVI